MAYLWSLGFGAVTGESLVTSYTPTPGTGGLVSTILIANIPQILLSFLYLTYNGLFTCMLLSYEWSSYARQRKGLRVTSAQGQQRSTYWLQLPYRYGIPLMAASAILHWLVSQSIFLARVFTLNEDGSPGPGNVSTLGYSNIAIIFDIMIGLILILFGIALGFRKYSGDIPLAGYCSAAISAACHPPKADDQASLKPVMWGVVADKKSYLDSGEYNGHCSFTSFEVHRPVEGRIYT